MRDRPQILLDLALCVMVLLFVGCGQRANKSDANKPGGPIGNAFLDKKKQIPPHLEWNTNINSKNGGTFSFRVESQGPFAVTVVNDAGYQAVQNKKSKAINKSDVLLTVDSKEQTYEGKVTVPPGTSWFIIENQADKEVEFHLQCFAP